MRKHEYERNPARYEHRVECTIHALRELGATVEKLSEYLEEQMDREWQDKDHLLEASRLSLKKAQKWVRNAMK